LAEKHTKTKKRGKSTGRKRKWMRRSARKDLEAFTLAVFTWLEMAPQKWEDDWLDQPVQLKFYSPRRRRRPGDKPPLNALGVPVRKTRSHSPQWILPSDASLKFLAESAYPTELLAVVAWDLIKGLRIHTGRMHANNKVHHLFKNKHIAKDGLHKLRSGEKPLLDHLAQSYGYLDADDERIPLKNRKELPAPTKVRQGNRAKTHAERRKPLFQTARKRWPKRPRHLISMTPRMMSYWRAHDCYEEASSAFKADLPVYQHLKRGKPHDED
jgi:hypothetical protein